MLTRILSINIEDAKSESALSFQVRYLIQRFSYDSSKGRITGDNRFYKKQQIDNIWFGDGANVSDIVSPQAVIHRYGIIPSIFRYIPILWLTIRIIAQLGFRRGKWFLFAIWANLMQRPTIDNLYVMTLWSLIYFALDYKPSFNDSKKY
jgi:hypothetical protein